LITYIQIVAAVQVAIFHPITMPWRPLEDLSLKSFKILKLRH